MTREEFKTIMGNVDAKGDVGKMSQEIVDVIWECWKDHPLNEFMRESDFFLERPDERTSGIKKPI